MENFFRHQIGLATVMSQCMYFHMYTFDVKVLTSLYKICLFLFVA